ncbi:MAG: alkaline phosphatase family protein [Nanoarchaeota archaeon]|nr:alkaline phosphatase family protein [Nanoarchaeota archaeon]
MYKFNKPNYKNGSIVNLMSSISNNYGKKHKYKQLPSLQSKELKKFKNIVLIVIDGMGYKFLNKQKESFMYKHLKTQITSTFLSTTTCANTTFHTGYPPQQHGLTGWDINLKETGAITSILPFTPLFGRTSLSKYGFNMTNFMNIKPFHKSFKAKCYTLIDKSIAHSEFTTYVASHTEIIPTSSEINTFTKIKQIIKKRSTKRKFIHAYFPNFDSMAHSTGINSKEVKHIFKGLDKRIKSLTKTLNNTNTKLIIVADHGLIDTVKKNELWVENIKGLKECLTIPMTGEPRVRDCFVRPGKVKDFKRIIKTKLSKYCWCFKGEQLIKDNLYGLGKPSKKLLDRVGDYVLIMKKNYILRDRLINKNKPKIFGKGHHAGVTDDEMLIPLITIDC